jgi:ABC-type transporter Mla subunit MlaD
MATLTKLESKLAEVLGLAMAAQIAVDTVSDLLDDDAHPLTATLARMRDESRETQKRVTELAGTFDRKKTAIVTAARETKAEAVAMMETYLEGEEEVLDGLEFLTMAEAGEVGHWLVVAKLNQKAGHPRVAQVADWAVDVQRDHFSAVLDAAVALAGEEDPDEPED